MLLLILIIIIQSHGRHRIAVRFGSETRWKRLSMVFHCHFDSVSDIGRMEAMRSISAIDSSRLMAVGRFETNVIDSERYNNADSFNAIIDINTNRLSPRQSQRIRDVAAFYHEYQEEPLHRGTRRNSTESKLAAFINHCRRKKRSHNLEPELTMMIEREWPWYSWDSLFMQRHRRSIRNVASFYDIYREEPKQRGSRCNGTESVLALYINNRRVEKGKGTMVDEVQALIEETWPWFDWESPIIKQHRCRLEEVKNFYSKHQEEPRNGGSRWNGTEDQLACYIGNRRKEKKNNKLDAQVQLWIEEEWPWFDWQSPILTLHQQRALEVQLFYDEFQEEPCIGGNRWNSSEHRLATYISSRRYECNMGTLDPSIRALIEQTWMWFHWESPLLQQHRQRIDEISLFYWVFREEPKRDGNRWNGTEYVLGNYLVNRRSERRAGLVSPMVVRLLDEMCPWFDWDRCDVNINADYHRNESFPPGFDGTERIEMARLKRGSFQYLDSRSIFIYNKIQAHRVASERL